ncbi:MAG: cation transporter [Alphaproteobacteria bacterium PRO2]|nr:cation transporter [Alphaproteobacteria bacterium PRO2]
MPHDHHDHDHSHEGHSHVPAVSLSNERRIFWVMILTGGFMAVEIIGGLLSGSLALLADAGHMLTDTAALFLAWFAFRIGNRPADPKRSFGYQRFQILAAFANSLALFAIAGWIVVEAIDRLFNPSEIHGLPMLSIAIMGLLVNIAGFWIMSRGEKGNLNIQSAALHVMGDLLGSVAAIIAAVIILGTSWTPIDPILSVLVAILILRSAWTIIKQSSHILLQGTPEGLDPARIGAALGDIEGVTDVHDVHAWSLTNERPVVTLHAVLDEAADYNTALNKINAVLKENFGIEHATIQIERKERSH